MTGGIHGNGLHLDECRRRCGKRSRVGSKIGNRYVHRDHLLATGDSSIATAMANGGITKIHHVDCKIMSVLGVYAKYTTVVYGE